MGNLFAGIQHFLLALSTAILAILPFHQSHIATPLVNPTSQVENIARSSANVLGISKEASSTPTPKPKVALNNTNPLINCIGPDGKLIKLTQKQCNDFNSSWGKSGTSGSSQSQNSNNGSNSPSASSSTPIDQSTSVNPTIGQQISSIHAGDIIGNMVSGASACSSGTNLEFEVYQNGSVADPNIYLSSHSFNYIDNDGGTGEGSINPHGSWNWPIDDPIEITQGYGMTPYAKLGFYGGGQHNGISMYSSSSPEVKAVHDGTIYGGTIPCGGGAMPYVRVDHGDGISTYYLHVNPITNSSNQTPAPTSVQTSTPPNPTPSPTSNSSPLPTPEPT